MGDGGWGMEPAAPFPFEPLQWTSLVSRMSGRDGSVTLCLLASQTWSLILRVTEYKGDHLCFLYFLKVVPSRQDPA